MPFMPNQNVSLSNRTVAANALQIDFTSKQTVENIYVRNLNPHVSASKLAGAWDKYKAVTTARPFILTDSTWIGTSRYASPLITNQKRDWDSLKYMINTAYALSMTGTRNFMVDSCGALGPLSLADEEICLRWTQAASLMPMLRQHYNATYLDSKNVRQNT